MTKLGSKKHIYSVYYRGRDYIIKEVMPLNTKAGLVILRNYIASNWDTIMEIMEDEDENGREQRSN